MTKIDLNLMKKSINLYKKFDKPEQKETNKTTPIHIRVKQIKIKNEEIILKAAKENHALSTRNNDLK